MPTLEIFAKFIECVLDALLDHASIQPEHVHEIEIDPWGESDWWAISEGWAFNIQWDQATQQFEVVLSILQRDVYEIARDPSWPTWEELQASQSAA